MLYQLPNGKVIEISTEQYLEMSDEELEYLIAYNYGEIMEDPWFGSVLSKKESSTLDVPDTVEDLIDIPEEEKLTHPDIDFDPEED
jgi:hypothetical protein